eukprot:921048-Pyramimonas_sp.AAC.1
MGSRPLMLLSTSRSHSSGMAGGGLLPGLLFPYCQLPLGAAAPWYVSWLLRSQLRPRTSVAWCGWGSKGQNALAVGGGSRPVVLVGRML